MFVLVSQKITASKCFDGITGLRFGKTKLVKEKFYGAKKLIKICDVDVDNIVISKLIETKNKCKYLIGCLSDIIRSLALILPKIIGCVKTFKDNNNKSISLHKDDGKLLEKYRTTWIRIE